MRTATLKWIVAAALAAVRCHSPAPDQTTPLETHLPDDRTTLITCRYAGHEGIRELPASTAGTYHYRVYIPSGYSRETTTHYPCIFISDPSGHASLGTLGRFIQRERWIALMLVEARNGPWGPVLGNFLAAHDDAMRRLRCNPRLKYATGVSGGARGSSVYTMLRPGFAGLLLQAGGFPSAVQVFRPLSPELAVYATFGDQDPNLKDDLWYLKELRLPFKHEVFAGGHQPAPSQVVEHAFAWFKEQRHPGASRPRPRKSP